MLQSFNVILFFAYFVLQIVVVYIVLSKRVFVVLAQTRPSSHSEIMLLLSPTQERALILETNVFLLYQSVSILHIVRGAWKFFLYNSAHTFLPSDLALNLSYLKMTPKGLFLLTF